MGYGSAPEVPILTAFDRLLSHYALHPPPPCPISATAQSEQAGMAGELAHRASRSPDPDGPLRQRRPAGDGSGTLARLSEVGDARAGAPRWRRTTPRPGSNTWWIAA